jgi:hypothetical protein
MLKFKLLFQLFFFIYIILFLAIPSSNLAHKKCPFILCRSAIGWISALTSFVLDRHFPIHILVTLPSFSIHFTKFAIIISSECPHFWAGCSIAESSFPHH